jgi:hypothetical protein
MGTQLASNLTILLSTIGSLASAAGLLISLLLLTRPTRETARRVKQVKKALARNGSITFGFSQGKHGKRSIVIVRNPTNRVLYVKEVRLLAREKSRENFYDNIIMNPENDVEEGAGKIKVEPHQDQKWWTEPWSTSDPLEEPEAIAVLYYIEANNEIHHNTVETLIEKYTPRDKKLVDRYWAEFRDGIEIETSKIDWKSLSILDLSKVNEMIHKRHMRTLIRSLRRLNVEKRKRLILGIPPKK